MHPRSTETSPTIGFGEPLPPPSRGKRAVRVIISLIHILIALLLLVIIILTLFSNRRTFFIFYILPLVILTLVVEICHLHHKNVPSRISKQLGGLLRLRIRAFVYQAAAALGIIVGTRSVQSCWGSDNYHQCRTIYDNLLVAVAVTSWVVWSMAVTLFVLAIVSSECGFEDWVEIPEGGEEERKIQLVDSDSEAGDLVGTGGVSRV